jgi:hypothetical protein
MLVTCCSMYCIYYLLTDSHKLCYSRLNVNKHVLHTAIDFSVTLDE